MSAVVDAEQAAVNRAMQPWTDKEIARFTARVGLFKRRGFAEGQAERVADMLALRDQLKDDRRLCVECSNYQRSGTCFRKLTVTLLQLIRCQGFEWQKP